MASNNISRSYSAQDAVFIEKDQSQEIDQMRKIMKEGSPDDIKNFFFKSSTSSDLNISGVAQNQIKKHSQVLNLRNKNCLKYMLKQVKETGSLPS